MCKKNAQNCICFIFLEFPCDLGQLRKTLFHWARLALAAQFGRLRTVVLEIQFLGQLVRSNPLQAFFTYREVSYDVVLFCGVAKCLFWVCLVPRICWIAQTLMQTAKLCSSLAKLAPQRPASMIAQRAPRRSSWDWIQRGPSWATSTWTTKGSMRQPAWTGLSFSGETSALAVPSQSFQRICPFSFTFGSNQSSHVPESEKLLRSVRARDKWDKAQQTQLG